MEFLSSFFPEWYVRAHGLLGHTTLPLKDYRFVSNGMVDINLIQHFCFVLFYNFDKVLALATST